MRLEKLVKTEEGIGVGTPKVETESATWRTPPPKGIKFTTKAIINLLKLNSDNNVIVNYILDRTPRNCVVFLTGVGKAYPILRSHNVLNNLHQKLDEVPVVLFFPGKYSGRDLVLFNTIEGSNYYRAFPLIQR